MGDSEPTPRYLTREKACFHVPGDTDKNVHSGIICNNPKLGATQVFHHNRMDKSPVWLESGMLLRILMNDIQGRYTSVDESHKWCEIKKARQEGFHSE